MSSPDSHGNVTDFLLEGKDPRGIALRFTDRDYSYGELQDSVAAVAKGLLLMEGKPGDRVLLIGDNTFFWVSAYLGIMRAGMVSVPLPGGISPHTLAEIGQTTEAGIAFAQAQFAAKNSSSLSGLHLITDREIPLLPGLASQRRFEAISNDGQGDGRCLPIIRRQDLAALMFTSGSTGQPRGVMVSHGNIMANTESIIQSLHIRREDRMMTVLPFHYCFGTSLLHTHLRAGASLIIDVRFRYPETVLQRMLDTECTGFAGVPSHFQILLRSSTLLKKSFTHLRYVQQAGGHLAPSFVRELRDGLPRTQIYIMYGQTEATARLSYLPPEFLDTKPGSIGKAIPGVQLRVMDAAGQQLPPGEVGEIVAEGQNVTQGYWRAPEDTAVCFRDGKLHTGDLATMDADGFFFVVDRARDFVKCGGQRVSCQLVEDQLLECEDLIEAAVIGVPDDILGEAVKAFVVPRTLDLSGLEADLLVFCKGRMPPAVVPREIVVMKSLPKNSAGKVLKVSLRSAP